MLQAWVAAILSTDFLEFGLLRLLLPDQVDAWSEVHGHDLSLGHTTSETNSKVWHRPKYIAVEENTITSALRSG